MSRSGLWILRAETATADGRMWFKWLSVTVRTLAAEYVSDCCDVGDGRQWLVTMWTGLVS